MDTTYYKKQKFPPLYTQVFRDPEVWEALKRELMQCEREKTGNAGPKAPLRVFRAWSAGCATGEEAYSLASTLDTVFQAQRAHCRVYATDIALTEAQRRNERSTVRFCEHDLVTDAPLRLMNLILCRNVLMFFKPEYQEMICKKLHAGLRTGGLLVLGKAERLRGEAAEQFTVIDPTLKLYRKI